MCPANTEYQTEIQPGSTFLSKGRCRRVCKGQYAKSEDVSLVYRIEQNRIEQIRIDLNRIEQNRVEQIRIDLNKIEQNRIEQSRVDQNRFEQNRIE